MTCKVKFSFAGPIHIKRKSEVNNRNEDVNTETNYADIKNQLNMLIN